MKNLNTRPVELKGNEKICKTCKSVKLMDDFYKKGVNGRYTDCKDCYKTNQNLKSRMRWREDSEYRERKLQDGRNYFWKYKYGVTAEQVVKTLEAQHNKCANLACGTEISLTTPKGSEKRAVIDHDHATDEFRALLCQRCNMVLGQLESFPDIIIGLDMYKHFHKSKFTHKEILI